MKNVISVLTVFLSLFAGGFVFAGTGNIIAGAAATYAASEVIQFFTGPLSVQGLPSALCVLAAIKESGCAIPNPGGINKIWVAPKDQFDGEWGIVNTAGEITTNPVMKEGFVGFTEIGITDKKAKANQSLKGATGYQTFEKGLESKIAGDTVAQTLAISKFINTEVICVYQMNDGQRKIAGNTYFPLTFEADSDTAENGGERSWVIRLKSAGDPQPNWFVKSTVVIPIEGVEVEP